MARDSRRRSLGRFLRREPTQARSRALVDSIVDAFDQLLRTFSDERDVTIERLVARAGVGIGSFYEYFTNRDSLIGALVERATRENFDALLADYDKHEPTTLEDAVALFANRIASTYLAHPARTRMLLIGIGRLNLLDAITAERDRFAAELATRASRLVPGRDRESLLQSMIAACDAVMGVVVGQLYRPPRSLEDASRELAQIGLAVLRAEPATVRP
jgi:AcrR family transcriptional regulator